jgi:hypothetical protein
VINELAWAGTVASSSDEWIELQNLGSSPIDLDGWHLTDGGDINVALGGTIPPFSYFLLERTDESTIADVAANQIYTGSLANSGERLELLGPSGAIVDTANGDGGGWPAGDAGSRSSMERRGGSNSRDPATDEFPPLSHTNPHRHPQQNSDQRSADPTATRLGGHRRRHYWGRVY